jgi:hypothetical protein
MAYATNSPYYATDIVNNQFLDIMINRPIPVDPTDVYFIITGAYNLRPDLLAYDLYNDPKLWWVFAQRNPNRLVDPFFDFKIGLGIYVPKIATLKTSLGI